MKSGPNPTVGTLAHPGQVDVRITAKASSRDEALKLITPVEAEARAMLGNNIFALDDESMESVVGRLLKEKNLSIASYEDLTGGLVADRLQQASRQHFAEGIINNTVNSMRHILRFSRQPDKVEELLSKDDMLTQELAWAVKNRSETDIGLAVHMVPEEGQTAENLARGKTFIAVVSDKVVKSQEYSFAGRGVPDRTRTSLNSLDLLRHALMEMP
jgi:nicotinamide-nucleotide amidase